MKRFPDHASLLTRVTVFKLRSVGAIMTTIYRYSQSAGFAAQYCSVVKTEQLVLALLADNRSYHWILE